MTLPTVCELVGDDYVTFNTDYPHADGTFPIGMEKLEEQPLSEKSIRKIYWENAAPVFGVACHVLAPSDVPRHRIMQCLTCLFVSG